MVNMNPETGVAYGYISANSLDSELVDTLIYGTQAVDASYQEALQAHIRQAQADADAAGVELDMEDATETFINQYETYEPQISGVYEGVTYSTSWLGGALHIWVFESPHTGTYRPCSPCVPGAADLDSPSEDGVEGYTVPDDWLNKH